MSAQSRVWDVSLYERIIPYKARQPLLIILPFITKITMKNIEIRGEGPVIITNGLKSIPKHYYLKGQGHEI